MQEDGRRITRGITSRAEKERKTVYNGKNDIEEGQPRRKECVHMYKISKGGKI